MKVITILDEYEKFGLDFVIWRNDYPYPKGTKITLNDVSINHISNLIDRCSQSGDNDEYISILKDAILRKRLQKIEKIKDRIQCQKQ